MKQPMAYGKGAAHKARQTRSMAAGMKSRQNVYKRVAKWEEFNVGTEDFSIKVTLKEPWSFSELERQSVEEFTNLERVMRGLRFTYKVAVAPAEIKVIVVELNKLTALLELSNKLQEEKDNAPSN